ncbi:unnamed protein product [Paramecium octaurelia]|uniref:Uncharacterized protein n=1 Tax=Paramecium octaurelia TaxID=43137 RepID=A0A8S1VJJ5_PAROT|nr:unnamed protein product [Paramecium octaurelia]
MACQKIDDDQFEQQLGEIKNFKIGDQKCKFMHLQKRANKNQCKVEYQKKVRASKKISKKQLNHFMYNKSCQQDESIQIQQEGDMQNILISNFSRINLNYLGENNNNPIEEIKTRLFNLNLEESNKQFYTILDSNHIFGFINQIQ